MAEKYTPKVSDRVRVVLEGEVVDSQARAFVIGAGDRFANWIGQNSPHVVSIEKISLG